MSAPRKKGLCAYCGQLKTLSNDHVPPKLLLDQPFPPNLWVVPACDDCTSSFKKDDEYTRTTLAQDIRATWNFAAQSNLPAIIRSLRNPDARGFIDYLARQTSPSGVLTPSGGGIATIELEKERINRTGEHIMRGLYFRETRKPLPATATVRLASKAGLNAKHPDMLTIARLLQHLPDRRHGSLGTAFSYVAGFRGEYSVWGMLLYDFFFWFATVIHEEAGTGRPVD